MSHLFRPSFRDGTLSRKHSSEFLRNFLETEQTLQVQEDYETWKIKRKVSKKCFSQRFCIYSIYYKKVYVRIISYYLHVIYCIQTNDIHMLTIYIGYVPKRVKVLCTRRHEIFPEVSCFDVLGTGILKKETRKQSIGTDMMIMMMGTLQKWWEP